MKDIKELQEDSKALVKESRYMSVRKTLEKQSAQLRDALPPTISTKRFLRVIYTQLHKNPKLQECSKESLIASVFTAAERGMLPNGRHAALVPYWNSRKKVREAQFQEMYQGLIHLAKKAGDVKDVMPATIREKDTWSYELGMHRDLKHQPALGDRGDPIAYYAVIEFPDGSRTFGPGPMIPQEIERIRQRSKSKDDGPWITDYEAMAWKTVIKRNLKYIGASPELEEHLIEDDEREYGEIDVTPEFPEEERTVDEPARTQPEKPKWPQWDEQTKTWRDSAYEAFDPKKHSGNMSTNADGTFKKKRSDAGKKRPAAHPDEKTQPDAVGKATGGENDGSVGHHPIHGERLDSNTPAAREAPPEIQHGEAGDPGPWE